MKKYNVANVKSQTTGILNKSFLGKHLSMGVKEMGCFSCPEISEYSFKLISTFAVGYYWFWNVLLLCFSPSFILHCYFDISLKTFFIQVSLDNTRSGVSWVGVQSCLADTRGWHCSNVTDWYIWSANIYCWHIFKDAYLRTHFIRLIKILSYLFDNIFSYHKHHPNYQYLH